MYVVLNLSAPGEFADILKAELANLGFDAFIDLTGDSFETSILEVDFNQVDYEEIIQRYSGMTTIKHELRREAKQNWNELWEANYPAVEIAGRVHIRAEFHAPIGFEHELLITTKMSFGTGHHETTSLLVAQQLELDHQHKRVADWGCGTGILAIMAMRLGAASADACDIEDWAVENAMENAALNQVQINAQLGTAEMFADKTRYYDLIYANINLHILLSELPLYVAQLAPNGLILFSGFYENEAGRLTEAAIPKGLIFKELRSKNRWATMLFQKDNF
jgi:ribosomal protein L11 methyltransferase